MSPFSSAERTVKPLHPKSIATALQADHDPEDFFQDADIPLPNEPDPRDYHSDDSHASVRGSDDEGEDLQEGAERCVVHAAVIKYQRLLVPCHHGDFPMIAASM